MDPRIRFETKEESNARRVREFLALTPSERAEWFFRSFNDGRERPMDGAGAERNFVIRKRDDAVR